MFSSLQDKKNSEDDLSSVTALMLFRVPENNLILFYINSSSSNNNNKLRRKLLSQMTAFGLQYWTRRIFSSWTSPWTSVSLVFVFNLYENPRQCIKFAPKLSLIDFHVKILKILWIKLFKVSEDPLV